VPETVRKAMTFHLATRVEDVLEHALEPARRANVEAA
jgi:hypothetical protein